MTRWMSRQVLIVTLCRSRDADHVMTTMITWWSIWSDHVMAYVLCTFRVTVWLGASGRPALRDLLHRVSIQSTQHNPNYRVIRTNFRVKLTKTNVFFRVIRIIFRVSLNSDYAQFTVPSNRTSGGEPGQPPLLVRQPYPAITLTIYIYRPNWCLATDRHGQSDVREGRSDLI